jgi:hypothetical protein
MMWWLPLAGALGGALLDKKNRGRGAMLGGLAGSAPGLLGAAGAAAPAGAGIAETAAMKAGAHGLGQQAGSMTGAKMMGLLGQAGQAAGAAQTVAGMMPQEQQAPMPEPMQARPGPDDSGFLASQSQQQQADEEQKRMRKMIEEAYAQRLMGGRNAF